ncbi:MAG TPA: hypothetical protein VK162_22620 [Streptosporangiaceae bacterium]|nr:hypothetical protein [Streptosporangiaceae bacterium]
MAVPKPAPTTAVPGDAVFGVVTRPALGDGAFGEYVTAPEACTALVPAGLDLATAGALGLAGTAALSAIDAIDPLPGETLRQPGIGGPAAARRPHRFHPGLVG